MPITPAELIANLGDLPPLPQVAAQVLRISADPDATAEDLRKVISTDQALTSQILKISNNSLVNNSFAAPGATGCGGFLVELLLNPIINAKLGLPAAAGNNTAILSGTLEQAGAEAVREH